MDDALLDLARLAGLSPFWTDAFGRPQAVPHEVLRALLRALDLPAETPSDIADSRMRLRGGTVDGLPPLMTLDAGSTIRVPVANGALRMRYRVTLEGGGLVEGEADVNDGAIVLPAIELPGYHRLELGNTHTTLAVAPARAFALADAAGREDPRLWGLAVQLYALRRDGDGGIGDFSALAQLSVKAANAGASALVLSPVHAPFAADPAHYSPYSPSSRLFLNPLYADPALIFGGPAVDAAVAALDLGPLRTSLEASELVQWDKAGTAKINLLRHLFETGMPREPALMAEFEAFRAAGGQNLADHAVFEALHQRQFGDGRGQWHWRGWPEGFRDPRGAAVAGFARRHAQEVSFHAFLQWVADKGLAQAQDSARSSGMPVGLISDLAVGADGGGSQAWSRQAEMLIGCSVGAPPDLLNSIGQTWGLTAFSPRAFAASGFASFLDMLRAAMAHAGGVRIDHIMGLSRLWMIPDGAPPADGAYLAYPFDDLARLVTLESHRRRAIVIGEDLGTVPEGFRERLASRGILGMRVLWFEREGPHFKGSGEYSPDAIAVTGTHDLPTVTGWWSGRDIDWRSPAGLLAEGNSEEAERIGRNDDRAHLWAAIGDNGLPAAEQGEAVLDAAFQFLAETPSPLVVVPMEDALALPEQPNLPGTVEEHPNWRRRLAVQAAHVLEDPAVQRRLSLLDRARTKA
ncbi:4-alpha-glucanotransferase [Roseixanthobacter pseudopolyaromaticivorans]|uniref:4-alpha-glucanotransferase n=1 Tax=Xanthobacteraceae TaxID=335928 RepID=UPI0037271F0A